MRRILSVVIMFAIVMSFPLFGFGQGQPAKKVYVVYLNDPQGSSFILQDIQSVDFNGVKCVQGTHVGAGWANNKTVYLPVDRITEIIEEDSLDQYKADTASPKK